MMTNVVNVVLKWHYSPENYFEEKITMPYGSSEVIIENGNIEARLQSDDFQMPTTTAGELTHQIKSNFLALQILTHKPFELSGPTRYDLREDGTKGYYLQVESGRIRVSGGTVDFIHRDKNGTIIFDSKQERLNYHRSVAQSVAKHRATDTTLDSMLRSYNAAVNDPDNELVHLYEIRDAAKKRFGNERDARQALDVSKDNWRRLGELANSEPVTQGRHRGQNPGVLRPADRGELDDARAIARDIIEGFVTYLEGMQAASAS